jgi:hypothetical protein
MSITYTEHSLITGFLLGIRQGARSKIPPPEVIFIKQKFILDEESLEYTGKGRSEKFNR